MTLIEAADPIDSKFLLCKCFCKLMDVTWSEESAAGCIERDLLTKTRSCLIDRA